MLIQSRGIKRWRMPANNQRTDAWTASAKPATTRQLSAGMFGQDVAIYELTCSASLRKQQGPPQLAAAFIAALPIQWKCTIKFPSRGGLCRAESCLQKRRSGVV